MVNTQDLTGAHLERFRTHLLTQRRLEPVAGPGVGRGAYRSGARKRSARTTNNYLRALRTILGQWRREGLAPKLDGDAIKDGLRGTKERHDLPRFLRTGEIKALLTACVRHDGVTFLETRKEHSGAAPAGGTTRYKPIAPFVVAALLTGCRIGELLTLRWSDVYLEAGEIILRAENVKTGQGRRIALDITPALRRLLERLKLQAGGLAYVFGGAAPLARDAADRARARLVKNHGAPSFTWHDLRRTAGTFLACAPGIYVGAGAFHAAKRLGHSVVVSERHYAGAVTDIAREAQTIEAAMGIEALAEQIIGAVAAPSPVRARRRA